MSDTPRADREWELEIPGETGFEYALRQHEIARTLERIARDRERDLAEAVRLLENVRRRAQIKAGDDPARECAHIYAEVNAFLTSLKGKEGL